jgi:predicted metal-dependent phosphoesterase TrpH
VGCPVDVGAIVETAARQRGRAIGRPHLARALVAAGHARSVQDAFDRWLGRGRPAFVPRTGVTPHDAIAALHEAGGVCAMAHPGVTERDAIIPSLVEAGLDAIEVWHSDHDAVTTHRYRSLASQLRLLVTGGSDFHGPDAGRVCRLGEVGLPEVEFARLTERIATCPASS